MPPPLVEGGAGHPPGRAEVQLAGVKQGHQLGELFGVGTEEKIDPRTPRDFVLEPVDPDNPDGPETTELWS